jgi:lycopene beta-cyclase
MEFACLSCPLRLPIVLQTLRRAAPTIRNSVVFISPLLLAWLAALAVMPVAQWSAGHLGLTAGVFLGVLLQVSLVVIYLAQAGGARRAAVTAGVIVAVAFGFEAVGWRTGFPFGAYHYTDALQPQLAGVPVLIPLAWLMMLPPAWAVAQRLTGRSSGVAFVVVSALAFSAWDLFVDPQMVRWGLWVWDAPGIYFGIPLSNFAGWLLVSGLITVLVRPPALPGKPLLVIYTLMWLVETVGQVVFWGLYGPALWGSVGMGLFVWLAWRRERGRSCDRSRPAAGGHHRQDGGGKHR